MSGFPPNPTDGQVVKINDEVYYQYDAAERCWKRLPGIGNVGPATVDKSGLMTAEDFIKVDDIIIPGFDTSISTVDCELAFRDGRIELISSEDDIEISEQLQLFKPDGEISQQDWIIHNNTMGIDFRVNIARLVEELENRGQLRYLQTVGQQGPPGKRGPPGENFVETGPVGEQGDPGANAVFLGGLVENTNDSVPTNKAVVDVRNDDDNPKKIIVTIGNIGNPSVGPKTVTWKNKNSPWLMGLKTFPFQCDVPPECAPGGNIIYIDVQPILDKLQSRFEQIVGEMKTEKEALVEEYTESLASLFAAQRQAVCCALEAVTSRKINQKIRNIWSNGRYQAAQAGYTFTATDSAINEQPRDVPQQTPGEFYPGVDPGDPQQNVIINGDFTKDPINWNCRTCYVQVTLNNSNLGPSRSVVVPDLPAFDYVATIIDCCIFHDGVGATGKFNIIYKDENDENQTIESIDRGFFGPDVSEEEYTGDAISFRHNGGDAKFYLDNVATLNSNGQVVICIQPSSCYQSKTCVNPNPIECDPEFFIFGVAPGRSSYHEMGDAPRTIAIVYDFFTSVNKLNVYYPPYEDNANLIATTDFTTGASVLDFEYTPEPTNDLGTQVLVVVTSQDEDGEYAYSVGCSGEVTGGGLPVATSTISSSHAEFYERSWRTGSCCGAHLSINGSRFIAVFITIGADCHCGGGEYEDTPFIKDFKQATGGTQVAIAWPTIDGETFFGLPRGEGVFIQLALDIAVSNTIIEKIRDGDVIKAVGDQSVISKAVIPIA